MDATEARFDYSGTYLVAGGSDIRAWHTKTWAQVLEVRAQGRVPCIAVGPDALSVAAGCPDNTVKIWGV